MKKYLVLIFIFNFWVYSPFAFADNINIQPEHAIAMRGKPKYSKDFKHFNYVNPNAPKGGNVKLAMLSSFDSLNPFIMNGEPPTNIGLLFDSLTVSSDDEPFTQYGLIAELIVMPANRSWVGFHLRKEAKFHDQTPITSEDVVFTFNTLREKGSPFYRFYYGDVDKVTAVNRHYVRFDFKEGNNHELPLIIGQMPVLPKHYWSDKEFDKTTLQPPLGSGPYKILSFEVGRYITYQRVNDYWAKDLPVNIGKHNFDTIRYDVYRDTSVAVKAFLSGNFDIRHENEAKKWAVAYNTPAVSEGRIIKSEFKNEMPSGMQGFVYNIRRPLFADNRVRQALAYAFDFDWSNKILFHNQYVRTKSYFDNSHLASKGLPSPKELRLLEPLKKQIPPEVFIKEYAPPSSDASGYIRENLQKAVKLLNEAGWDFKDGIMVNQETNEKFTFDILVHSSGASAWERICLPFIKNLKRIGIVANVRIVDVNLYINRLRSFDFDVIVGVFPQSLSPGNEQKEFFGSQAADREGSRNYIGIKNPAVDVLIDKVISATSEETLETATRALDRVLLWNHYIIPNWHIPYDRIAYWNKFGIPDGFRITSPDMMTWWLK